MSNEERTDRCPLSVVKGDHWLFWRKQIGRVTGK